MLDKPTLLKIKKVSDFVTKRLEAIENDPNIKTNSKRSAEYPMDCDKCGRHTKFAYLLFHSFSKKFVCFRCFIKENHD